VNAWLDSKDTLTFSEFDTATNTWEFGIIMCSEKYAEILPLLFFCENLSAYKPPSPDDFMIIYPYIWGDSGVMAYATYSQEGFVLSCAKSVTDVAKNHLDYAASRFEVKLQEFGQEWNLEDL
jgi:hypothetical protein